MMTLDVKAQELVSVVHKCVMESHTALIDRMKLTAVCLHKILFI